MIAPRYLPRFQKGIHFLVGAETGLVGDGTGAVTTGDGTGAGTGVGKGAEPVSCGKGKRNETVPSDPCANFTGLPA